MNATLLPRPFLLTFAFTLWAATFAAPAAHAAAIEIRRDSVSGQFDFFEGSNPILRYNFQKVEPGALLEKVSPANRIYARARSDYIHPLFGLNAEVLTADWPVDHPHHRGIYWAWPEVDFGTNRGDLHALQKVFARPSGRVWITNGSRSSQLEAENLWLWDDREPIVREHVLIRAYCATEQGRVIDLAFSFLALKDGLTLARRGMEHYGGLNLRLATPTAQQITPHTDATNAAPRRAWSDLSGVFGAASAPSGVTILQHQQNPDYPGEWVQYPNLSWCQPTFPATGTRYALKAKEPLILRYRLVIHPAGKPDDARCAAWWDEFNSPSTPALIFHQ